MDLIEPVRAASRQLVRELGFMEATLAGVDLPPSAVHALLEIEARPEITAGELSHILQLEKSSVSRMLRRLVDRGDVVEATARDDARSKTLSLSPEGMATVAGIHAFARNQVAAALTQLDPARQSLVLEGLRLYAGALGTSRGLEPQPVVIEAGWRVGALARCTDMHARYYAREAGFGTEFEALVASGLAEFSGRLERPCNRFWLALRGERIIGTLAIDGEDLGDGIAHLRWFIVDDEARGSGTGRRLLTEAIAFWEARAFTEIHLWTFQGLQAARHLYETAGFRLAEERPGRQWGKEVLEQRFVRPIGHAAFTLG